MTSPEGLPREIPRSLSVLRVGVTQVRYVTHESCRPWLIFSYKNLKGRSASPEDAAEDDEPEPSTSGPKYEDKEPVVSDAGSFKNVRSSTDTRSSVDDDINHSGIPMDVGKSSTSDGREAIAIDTEAEDDLPSPVPTSPNHAIKLLLKNKSSVYIEYEPQDSDDETKDGDERIEDETHDEVVNIEMDYTSSENQEGDVEPQTSGVVDKEDGEKECEQKAVELPIFQSPPSVGRVVDLQVIGNQVVIKSTSTVGVDGESEKHPRFLLVESSDGSMEVVMSENMADADMSADEGGVTDVSSAASPSHISSSAPSPFTSPPASQPPSRITSPILTLDTPPKDVPLQESMEDGSFTQPATDDSSQLHETPMAPMSVSSEIENASSNLSVTSVASPHHADVPASSDVSLDISDLPQSASPVHPSQTSPIQSDSQSISLPTVSDIQSNDLSETSGPSHYLPGTEWPASAPVSVTTSPVPQILSHARETRSAAASPLSYSPATSPTPGCMKMPLSGMTKTASGVRIHLPKVRRLSASQLEQPHEIQEAPHQTIPPQSDSSEHVQDQPLLHREIMPVSVVMRPVITDEAEEIDSVLYSRVPPDLVSVTVPRDTDVNMEAEDSMYAVHQYIASSIQPGSLPSRGQTPSASPALTSATPQHHADSAILASSAAAQAQDLVSEVIHSTQFPSSDDESDIGEVPLSSYNIPLTSGMTQRTVPEQPVTYLTPTSIQMHHPQSGVVLMQPSVVRYPSQPAQYTQYPAVAMPSEVQPHHVLLPSGPFQQAASPVFLVRASPVKGPARTSVSSVVGADVKILPIPSDPSHLMSTDALQEGSEDTPSQDLQTVGETVAVGEPSISEVQSGQSRPFPLISSAAKKKLSHTISQAIASLTPASKDVPDQGVLESEGKEPISVLVTTESSPTVTKAGDQISVTSSKPSYSVKLSSMLGSISQPGTAQSVLESAKSPSAMSSDNPTDSEPNAKTPGKVVSMSSGAGVKQSGLAGGVTHLLVVPRGSEQRAQQLLAKSHPKIKPETLAAQLQGLVTESGQSTSPSVIQTTPALHTYTLQQTLGTKAPVSTVTTAAKVLGGIDDSAKIPQASSGTGQRHAIDKPTLTSVTKVLPRSATLHGKGHVSLLKHTVAIPTRTATAVDRRHSVAASGSVLKGVTAVTTKPTPEIKAKPPSVIVTSASDDMKPLSSQSIQTGSSLLPPTSKSPSTNLHTVMSTEVVPETTGVSTKVTTASDHREKASLLPEKFKLSKSLLRSSTPLATAPVSLLPRRPRSSENTANADNRTTASIGMAIESKTERTTHQPSNEGKSETGKKQKKSSGKVLMKASRTSQGNTSDLPTFRSDAPGVGAGIDKLLAESEKAEDTSPHKIPPAVRAKPAIPRKNPRQPKLPFKLSGSMALQALPLDVQQKVAHALSGGLGNRHTGPIRIKLPPGYAVPAGDKSIKVSVITPEQARQMGLPVPTVPSPEKADVKGGANAKSSSDEHGIRSESKPSTSKGKQSKSSGKVQKTPKKVASPGVTPTDLPTASSSGEMAGEATEENVMETEELLQVDGAGDDKPTSSDEQLDAASPPSTSASHVPNISSVLPQIPNITPSVWELTENMTTIQPLYGSQDSSVLSYPTTTVLIDDRGEVIAQSQADLGPLSLDPSEPIELLSPGISPVLPGQTLINIVPVTNRPTKSTKKGARREGTGSKKSQRQTAGVPPSKYSKWEQPEAAPAGGPYQRVRLVIRPWRTPDGTVNRPTLRTMLETMLAYVMTKPGITSVDIFKKYSPIMQPVPVMELLEMLEEIGCIERQVLSRSHKISLFSPRVQINPVPVDHGHEVVTFFPKIDCVLKLGHYEAQLFENYSKLPHQDQVPCT